jgi:hypothetical protein
MARKKFEPTIIAKPPVTRRNFAALSLEKSQRGHQYTYGLDYVCNNIGGNFIGIVDRKTIHTTAADTVLCSLTSPLDVYPLVKYIREPLKGKRLVVGGQGAYPFLAYRHLADRVFFGRVEGAAAAAVWGRPPDPYCYSYAADPHVDKVYRVRKARMLLPGEKSIGCRGACKFCQYRATHREVIGRDYDPASGMGHKVVEDRWADIVPKTGNQTTALDGWSEGSRRKVGKPISDDIIVEKLNEVLATIKGIMRLKVFQIVGYPWETRESITSDILRFRELLSRVRPGKDSRIMMMVINTPFSPEPLTKMSRDGANIEVNWRELFLDDKYRCIFDAPHLNAFSLPQIFGPLGLLKRVAVNRGVDADKLVTLSKCKTLDEGVRVTGDVWSPGAGVYVDGHLTCK